MSKEKRLVPESPDSDAVRVDWSVIESVLRHVKAERDEINARAVAEFGLDRIEGWSLDLQAGTVQLTTPSSHWVGSFEVLGSWNPDVNSWMWGWANPGISDDLTVASFGVHQFGESKQIPSLTTMTLWADEQEADSLATLAFAYAQSQFFFRKPGAPAFYLAVRNICAAPGSDQTR